MNVQKSCWPETALFANDHGYITLTYYFVYYFWILSSLNSINEKSDDSKIKLNLLVFSHHFVNSKSIFATNKIRISGVAGNGLSTDSRKKTWIRNISLFSSKRLYAVQRSIVFLILVWNVASLIDGSVHQ